MKSVALLGYGRMGKMHAAILNQLPEFELKYIFDHHSGEDVLPVSELVNGLQDPELDGVIIATSSDAHIEMIDICSRYQKKIFCEKPISYQIESIRQLRETLTDRGSEVQVGFNRRFDPHYSALKQRLDDGEIGEAQIIKITNRDPVRPDLAFAKRSGGLIYDFVIHDLDMVDYLSETSVTDIAVFADALIDERLRAFNDYDTALISLKLDSGALVAIDVSRESGIGYDQRIEVLGQKGMLKVDNQTPATLMQRHEKGTYQENPYFSFVERYQAAYRNQFLAYADWLNDHLSAPAVGLDQLEKALVLADRISAKLKQEVHLA